MDLKERKKRIKELKYLDKQDLLIRILLVLEELRDGCLCNEVTVNCSASNIKEIEGIGNEFKNVLKNGTLIIKA